jgi:hypothetical protein
LVHHAVEDDREIDSQDQSPFFYGEQEESNREGFIFWNGEKMYGVKWRNFFGRMVKEFQESVAREQLIHAGAPLDFVPERKES